MWLLHARTRKLESFVDDRQHLIQYAILSHTWDGGEVSFDDIKQEYAYRMRGYRKIDFACTQALRDGIEYVWIDTCCIDKRSSAELSEAINSMYRWYHDASICYAYLSDLDDQVDTLLDREGTNVAYDWELDVAQSRWFTRGWTLQELIAPKEVRFYDARWYSLGSKSELVDELEAITKVSASILKDRTQLKRASLAQRMSWAAGRETSRIEDQAYALLGLFDVNMPLLYGEGNKAFTRLQEEIVSDDGDLLAPSPREFSDGHQIISWTPPCDETFEFSKKGLCMTVLARAETTVATDDNVDDSSLSKATSDVLTVVLNCRYNGHEQMHQLAIQVRRRPRIASLGRYVHEEDQFDAVYDKLPGITIVDYSDLVNYVPVDITISRKPYCWPSRSIKKISMAGGLTHIAETHGSEIVWHRGHAIVQLKMDEAVEARGSVHVTKRFDTEHWSDVLLSICLIHEFRKPPKLSIWVERGPRYTFREGEQHMIEVESQQTLRITASFVLMDDDLLWHLELTRPVVEKDISDLQTISGAEGGDVTRDLSAISRAATISRRLSRRAHGTTLPEVFQGSDALPEVMHEHLNLATAPLIQEQLMQRHTLMALADAVERIQRQLALQEQDPNRRNHFFEHNGHVRTKTDRVRRPLKALRGLISGLLGRKPAQVSSLELSSTSFDDAVILELPEEDVAPSEIPGLFELPAEPYESDNDSSTSVISSSPSIHESRSTVGTSSLSDEVDAAGISLNSPVRIAYDDDVRFSFLDPVHGADDVRHESTIKQPGQEEAVPSASVMFSSTAPDVEEILSDDVTTTQVPFDAVGGLADTAPTDVISFFWRDHDDVHWRSSTVGEKTDMRYEAQDIQQGQEDVQLASYRIDAPSMPLSAGDPRTTVQDYTAAAIVSAEEDEPSTSEGWDIVVSSDDWLTRDLYVGVSSSSIEGPGTVDDGHANASLDLGGRLKGCMMVGK